MSGVPTSSLPSLGDAYAIERELGGGGMSRVFVATEVALGRRVAVKVLSAELLQGAPAERFAREIALAAQLQDSHIVPVHSAGTTGEGLPYFTMPFIEGESLRERMKRGAVAIDEALRILRDVAEALEYAHARGIVHRDIKPENVLLSGRNALVADFGIAKAVSAARAVVPNGTLTSIGMSLGTPGYMAPEQAAGDTVDNRADLYAWGMMAWELLAGRHPFAGRTAAQQMAAQISELPSAIDEVRPGLPPTLGALVMQCVAKSPAERPADAATVLAALGGATTDYGTTTGRRAPVGLGGAGGRRRTVIAAAVVVLALGAGGAWYTARGGDSAASAASASATPSLAVLPFEHQGDSSDVYLTEGITDEVRNKLAGVQNLVVIARASSNQYRGSKTTPQEIAKELGVRWLLTGTVRVVGNGEERRVLVRPELVEVMSDGRLQSRGGQPFDGPLTDVVRAQGEVASQVVASMEVAVGGADRAKLVAVPTRNAEAYDLYLRALAATNGGVNADVASLDRAIGLHEQAIARDSTMAEAWAALGTALSARYINGGPTPTFARRAREAVERAMSLAPGSADAQRARANYLRAVELDWTGAIATLEQARRLAPGDDRVLRNLAVLKADLGRLEDALGDLDQLAARDPRAANSQSQRSAILLRLGRVVEARAAAERGMALAPSSLALVNRRVMAAIAAGDLADARRAVDAAARDLPRERVIAYLGLYYELSWMLTPEDARLLLSLNAAAFDGTAAHGATVFAQQYGWNGDTARARLSAESAARGLADDVRHTPGEPQNHVFLGLMRAYSGDSAGAMTAVARGLALADARADARLSIDNAYYHYVAARAAVLARNHLQAIAWLRESRTRRYFASPAWIRLDPSFAPLRGDPAFERLLTEAP